MDEGATNKKISKGILTVKGDFWINYKLFFHMLTAHKICFTENMARKVSNLLRATFT